MQVEDIPALLYFLLTDHESRHMAPLGGTLRRQLKFGLGKTPVLDFSYSPSWMNQNTPYHPMAIRMAKGRGGVSCAPPSWWSQPRCAPNLVVLITGSEERSLALVPR